MMTQPTPDVPKSTLAILNNLYEMERKLAVHGDPGKIARNIEKMKDVLDEVGLYYEDPMGQEFKDTRTDLEATISGTGTENLRVVEVIKPIIRWFNPTQGKSVSRVAKKGIVIVESQPETTSL